MAGIQRSPAPSSSIWAVKTIGGICLVLGLLAALIAFGSCYAGRDCKPGQACWQDCATNPGGPGCVDPWQPIPIEAKPDGGSR